MMNLVFAPEIAEQWLTVYMDDMAIHTAKLPNETDHPSAKINISYSILFNLTTSYSSYFGGKKGISRNKTSFFY